MHVDLQITVFGGFVIFSDWMQRGRSFLAPPPVKEVPTGREGMLSWFIHNSHGGMNERGHFDKIW